MNNYLKRFVALFLIVTSGVFLTAQSLSYRSLSQDIQKLQKQLVPDKRTAILKIEIKDTLQPVITVSGETDLPGAKEKIVAYLKNEHILFVDSVKLLPDPDLGEKIWGLTTISVANMYASSTNVSELVSQVLLGTPVKILSHRNEWYRIQTPEHYIGWIDCSSLQMMTAEEMTKWKKSQRYLFIKLSGSVYDKPTIKGNIVTDLVLCNLFETESTIKGFLKIRIPDGRTGYVRKSDCISFDDWVRADPNIQSVLSVARRMMGSPYLWGGVSSKAADCSGFVKLVYYYQAVILARDASQQARYGEKIDFTNVDNLKPGDLLFFGNSAQQITHVGMYLDKGEFIHCSGKVQINSLIPGNPKYNPARNNVGACRIVNSLNTDGITRVKDHPWYITQ